MYTAHRSYCLDSSCTCVFNGITMYWTTAIYLSIMFSESVIKHYYYYYIVKWCSGVVCTCWATLDMYCFKMRFRDYVAH